MTSPLPPPPPRLSPSGGEGCAVDPITLEIIRGSLGSTIRDMELLMERCAMSPFIKEKKDYFVGVFDTRGRIVAEGRLNEEAYRIFLRNSRLPDLVEGDTRAMMASCRLADARLTELCGRYGADTVLAAFDECIAQTAVRARELFLQMIPEGRWSFHDFLDSDGGTEQRPFRIELELERTGDHVRLDGSRSDDQARGPINYTTNAGLLRIAFGRYLQSLDADLDVNEGLLRNLDEWIAREGSILKPRFPAPLGMRANTRFRVMSCIFGSLAEANGGKVPAGSPV